MSHFEKEKTFKFGTASFIIVLVYYVVFEVHYDAVKMSWKSDACTKMYE